MGVRVGAWPVFCGDCRRAWSTARKRGDHSTCPSCGGFDVRHARPGNDKGEPESYFEAIEAIKAIEAARKK